MYINLVILFKCPAPVHPSFPSFYVFASEVRSVEGIRNASFQSPLSYFSCHYRRSRGPWPEAVLSSFHPAELIAFELTRSRPRPYIRKSFRVKCTIVYKIKELNITRRGNEGIGLALSVCLCHSLKLWLELSTWPVLFSWVDQSHQNRHPYDHLLSASCPLWC